MRMLQREADAKIQRGFSLAELLVALTLFAVAILAVIALSLSVARGNQEGFDTSVGSVVTVQLVDSLIDQLRVDEPAGVYDDFWDNDYSTTPFSSGSVVNNGTEFDFTILAKTVVDSSGTEIGSAVNGNRLKKVDIAVYWWKSDTQVRQGYGELRVVNSRLISEAEL
jgi:prepilin-type N-terminal cleavage/methylation domain-containing protein